jgi:hypothetical protein
MQGPTEARHRPIATSELAVVGLVRNGQKTLRHELAVLRRATRGFARLHYLIVESDSSDATLEVLGRLQAEMPNFRSISLGALADRHPLRTDRMASCRNRYLDELSQNPLYANVDYVMVADLDGVNRHLTAQAIATCWQSPLPWDVCAANQRDAYYDVWALRHAAWCPDDCWRLYHRLRPLFGHEQALTLAVHSRMVRLAPTDDWIEVDSAFGGLAIYRRDALLTSRYRGLDEYGEQICEHVPFHAGLRARGARLFINPALINARRTDRSARAALPARLRRRVESWGKGLRKRWRGR